LSFALFLFCSGSHLLSLQTLNAESLQQSDLTNPTLNAALVNLISGNVSLTLLQGVKGAITLSNLPLSITSIQQGSQVIFYDTTYFTPTTDSPITLSSSFSNFSEPLYHVKFQSVQTSTFQFSVIAAKISTDNTKSMSEITLLGNYVALQLNLTKGIVVMGDLRAACSYVDANWATNPFRTTPSLVWINPDSVSTVKSSNCAYDRIISDNSMLPQSFQVVRDPSLQYEHLSVVATFEFPPTDSVFFFGLNFWQFWARLY